jgi:hypothetical protein
MTTTTYVTYDLPGAFLQEQATYIVPSRDPHLAANTAPNTAYAFTFNDIVSTVVDGVELKSKPQNVSNRYFIGGTVHTAMEVESMTGNHEILLSNMCDNGWDRVIFLPSGNVQPFKEGDTLVQDGNR